MLISFHFVNEEVKNLNLEKGVWLLIKTTFPHINEESYQKVLDGYAERVRKECNPQQSFPSTLMTINRIFFMRKVFLGIKHITTILKIVILTE